MHKRNDAVISSYIEFSPIDCDISTEEFKMNEKSFEAAKIKYAVGIF